MLFRDHNRSLYWASHGRDNGPCDESISMENPSFCREANPIFVDIPKPVAESCGGPVATTINVATSHNETGLSVVGKEATHCNYPVTLTIGEAIEAGASLGLSEEVSALAHAALEVWALYRRGRSIN